MIDRIIPDKAAAAKAKQELAVLEQTGELKLLTEQLEVNKNEALHRSVFVAGWRPFVGWVCATAFAYHFVALPILLLVAQLNGTPLVVPAFDMGSLMTVLGGILGIGGLRSFEKFKGVSK